MSSEWIKLAAVGLIALGIGYGLGRRGGESDAAAPTEWLARVGDQYVDDEMFVEEMRRSGGELPGQFQTLVQKRDLLDRIIWRQALVHAARDEGLDRNPTVARQLDLTLANVYLQNTLHAKQKAITVTDAEVAADYEANKGNYTIPARRRVAMIQINVPQDASDEQWQAAVERADQALAKAAKLPADTPHFGAVAREFSQDQASRYRGGTIGWITEGQQSRYRYDPVVLEAAMAATRAGEFSRPLRGKDAVYVVRVVDLEAARERPLADLSTGIHQRLRQERLAASEEKFRQDLLKSVGVEVREAGLEAIKPLSTEPKPPATPEPPALPAN